jgi:tellurite methyltransferase
MTGGYDNGYSTCPCFWGRKPGSLVRAFANLVPVAGKTILDLGCGEGKNAVFLADAGGLVVAVDCSEVALRNARNAWPRKIGVDWVLGDATTISLEGVFDVVVSYGFLHCLAGEPMVRAAIKYTQELTAVCGYNIICTFNDRAHPDLALAHSAFSPCLLSHAYFCDAYDGWELTNLTDSDLSEVHPHNGVRHSHSLTRFIARKLPR